jgi:RNA polymerase sigma-70 factor (ECF subfamily)
VGALAKTRRATSVEATVAPETAAAHALFERYSGPLYAFCLRRLGSREEAEDAVQSTFLNALRALDRGVRPQAESAWLYKIADNVCLTSRRSFSRRRRVELPSGLETLQEVAPAPAREGFQELVPLLEGLAVLPESQRKAVLLREWRGLSYREISAELGLSQPAVETLLFRARRSLARALETPRRRRIRGAGRVASLLAGLKALLGGGPAVAVKVALVVGAAIGGSAVIGSSVSPRAPHPPRHEAAATSPMRSTQGYRPGIRPVISVSVPPAASAGRASLRARPTHPASPRRVHADSNPAHHVRSKPARNVESKPVRHVGRALGHEKPKTKPAHARAVGRARRASPPNAPVRLQSPKPLTQPKLHRPPDVKPTHPPPPPRAHVAQPKPVEPAAPGEQHGGNGQDSKP